jgi:hypothetical protein
MDAQAFWAMVGVAVTLFLAALALAYHAGRRTQAQEEDGRDGAAVRIELAELRKVVADLRELAAEWRADKQGLFHRVGLLEVEVSKLRDWRHDLANAEHVVNLKAGLKV